MYTYAKKNSVAALLALILILPFTSYSQSDENKLGAWYMYFFNGQLNDSRWGVQGDIQYRNWNLGGDLEQLLIRGGATYKPSNGNVKFTLGYGNVTSGAYGESNHTTTEHRIYQEALIPSKLAVRVFVNHRFRFEQRMVENQNFRTRFRYNFMINVPLNKKSMESKTWYASFYNEIFLNAQRNIGQGKTVEIFDRNRFYLALGYVLNNNIKLQFGLMNQTTNAWDKNQLQVGLHQNF
tara:strand:+ start:8324 stop:9034 length:711 start_codon:yes stop_codon:yes gene_type:complete